MNKYRINVVFIFMLSLVVCTTETRHSRKRYSKKKEPNSINTLIDVDSIANNENSLINQFQTASVTGLPTASKNAFSTAETTNNDTVDASYTPLSQNMKIAAPIFEEESEEDSIEFNFEHADLQNF